MLLGAMLSGIPLALKEVLFKIIKRRWNMVTGIMIFVFSLLGFALGASIYSGISRLLQEGR